MHSQLLPPTIAIAPPPAIQGGCGGGGTLGPETSEDFAQGINLDLGIGSCGHGHVKKDQKIEPEKQEPTFSAWQFQEFFNQVLVYNRIISGFGSQNCDQTLKMDPEPGRCRRTDGRKWRCSRSVVPSQKYCERHVHRGRQGSRKHVEPTKHVGQPNDNKIPGDSATSAIPLVTTGMDNGVDASEKGGRNPAQHCCSNGNDISAIVDSGGSSSHDALVATESIVLGLEVNKNDNGEHVATSTCSNSINNGSGNEIDYTDGKKLSGFGNVNPAKISRRKQSVIKSNHHGFVSPGFGLSPKSVLHCGAGKASLSLDSKGVAGTEQQRCRRTDGKKWQCRRDTIPGQKYCVAHMHRGAKRIMLNQESSSNVPTSAHNPGTIAGDPSEGINLNTVPVSPQRTSGNNSTSSSSDATTISDENISSCLNRSLHKG